jgi:SseB protein N-terminal domain
MLRNVFDIYIDKITNGDVLYRQKLIETLSRRFLYIPFRQVVESQNAFKKLPEQVAIVLLEDSGLMVPVFTSENIARNWIKNNYPKAGLARRTGRDISTALNKRSGLIINPGQERSISLSPLESQEIQNVRTDMNDDSSISLLTAVDKSGLEETPLKFNSEPLITLLC